MSVRLILSLISHLSETSSHSLLAPPAQGQKPRQNVGIFPDSIWGRQKGTFTVVSYAEPSSDSLILSVFLSDSANGIHCCVVLIPSPYASVTRMHEGAVHMVMFRESPSGAKRFEPSDEIKSDLHEYAAAIDPSKTDQITKSGCILFWRHGESSGGENKTEAILECLCLADDGNFLITYQ